MKKQAPGQPVPGNDDAKRGTGRQRTAVAPKLNDPDPDSEKTNSANTGIIEDDDEGKAFVASFASAFDEML